MGLMIGSVSARDLILDGQSVSLYEGGNPPTKLWPTTRETVQITLGTDQEARDQLRAALSDRGLYYWILAEIPFNIELVGTGSAQNMFSNCTALTHVPDLDTSNVTNMSNMFYGCSSLTHVPNMDTSNVTSMYRMFYKCSSLTYVPDMDTSQVTSMYQMFYECAALTDGNVRLIGRNPSVNTGHMIIGSGLTREPFYEGVQITLGASTEARGQLRAALSDRGMDYKTVTEIPFVIELVGAGSAEDMFWGCAALTHAPAMDTSQVTNMSYMFRDCAALTYVPDMDTSQVTLAHYMFYNCSALTDGNVRLIGKHPNINPSVMIIGSGLTRVPFYDTNGNPI